MALLEPELKARQQSLSATGIVVLGTCKGDIHEIGESLVGTMLSANGYKVHDLGVDIDANKFIDKIEEAKADIVGLSALLTTTMTMQRQTTNDLIEAGLRDRVKVLVGGALVTRNWAEEIGADGYAEDAMGTVQVANKLMGNP